MDTLVRITASYSDGCFCNYERPLPQGSPFRTAPRFDFAKQARAYAEKHGLSDFRLGKEKTASAYLPRACDHRPRQLVRLSWELAH